MGAFWEGMLAGYGIAVPVGAIAILIIDVGLRRGFAPAWMAGAGAAAADALYAVLAAVAGSVLAAALAPFATALRLASALVLFAVGGWGLWQLRVARPAQATLAPARGLRATFGQFLGLTLLNPATIAYFAALILGRNAGGAMTVGAQAAWVAGAALASLSWQSLLAGVGALAHRRLSPGVQRATSIVGNLVVLALGVRLLVG